MEQPTMGGLAGASTCSPDDRHFATLRSAFRASGDLARGDDLARLLEDRHCGDFVTLPKLIVSRDVFEAGQRSNRLQFQRALACQRDTSTTLCHT